MAIEHVPQEKFKDRQPFNPPESPDQETDALTPGKNPLIEKWLGQLAEKGLFGRPYVQDYLYDLSQRSNPVKSCRSRSSPILFSGHSCPSTFPDLKTSHFSFDI